MPLYAVFRFCVFFFYSHLFHFCIFFWHPFFRLFYGATRTDLDRLDSSASSSDGQISLSYLMAVFSTNSFRLFLFSKYFFCIEKCPVWPLDLALEALCLFSNKKVQFFFVRLTPNVFAFLERKKICLVLIFFVVVKKRLAECWQIWSLGNPWKKFPNLN